MPPISRKRRISFASRKVSSGKRFKSGAKRLSARRALPLRRARRFRRRAQRFRRRIQRRRSGRRHHSRKGQVTFSKVVQALEPWQTYVAEYGQESTCPGVTAGFSSKPCAYFSVELYDNTVSRDTVTTIALNDYRHMASVANQLWKATLTSSFTGSVANSTTFATASKSKIIVKGLQMSTIRNQSTEPVVIKAWFLKPRHNIPLTNLNASTVPSIYRYLANGFANNSLDPSHINPSNNITMFDANYTPYNSFDVCRHFKIRQVKPRTVDPGRMTVYKIRSRSHTFRPVDYWGTFGSSTASGFGSSTGQQVFAMMKSARLFLWRIEGNPAGFGAVQGTYTGLIQETTPTVVVDTQFRYSAKWLWQPQQPSGLIEKVGIVDVAGAGHNPAIIVEGGDVIGEEKDAN